MRYNKIAFADLSSSFELLSKTALIGPFRYEKENIEVDELLPGEIGIIGGVRIIEMFINNEFLEYWSNFPLAEYEVINDLRPLFNIPDDYGPLPTRKTWFEALFGGK